MIMPRFKFDDVPENVYDLSFVKPETELVVHGKEKYIMNKDGYFPIFSDKSFIEKENNFVLTNEDGDVFMLSKDNFEAIKNLL